MVTSICRRIDNARVQKRSSKAVILSVEAVAAGIAANGPVCFILIARRAPSLLSKQDGERDLNGTMPARSR